MSVQSTILPKAALFMNLLESGFENGKGFEIANPTKLRDDVFYQWVQSRVVVSIALNLRIV